MYDYYDNSTSPSIMKEEINLDTKRRVLLVVAVIPDNSWEAVAWPPLRRDPPLQSGRVGTRLAAALSASDLVMIHLEFNCHPPSGVTNSWFGYWAIQRPMDPIS